VGFGRSTSAAPGSVDRALLKRVGAWLGTAVVVTLVRGVVWPGS
jgi:hypothetical protein